MPQLNDAGVTIAATINDNGTAVDLTGATSTSFVVRKGGASVTWNATVTDATAGKIQYITSNGDLSPVGRIEIQAHIVVGSQNFKTQVSHFDVMPNL